MPTLSPATLKRARSSYAIFNAFNSLSYILLAGSFITLFALRLGASNAFVGALNAFAYVTFFFLLLGKRLVRRRSIIRVFGYAWIARYLSMIPALFAPLLVAAGWSGAAFGLILASVAGFNVARGIGMIANNPVLALLGDGGRDGGRGDRSSFLVGLQIVSSLAGMGTNLFVALVLGKSASPGMFVGAMGVGIVTGVASSLLLFKTPEPDRSLGSGPGGLWAAAREAFAEKPFRRFIQVFFVLSVVAGMARTFLPVYAKEVFRQGDDAVMGYSLVASLGALAMGLLMRLLVDRLGSKPLYVIFTAVLAISLAPLAIVGEGAVEPGGLLSGPLAAAAFLVLVNFVSFFGLQGNDTAAQTYFFGLVKPERVLDLGVVYFIVFGIGGSIGAYAGGVALDLLAGAGVGSMTAYRLFFGFLLACALWVLWRMSALVRLGSATVRESLEVMLSLRDLRAINLLSRLDRSADPAEEIRLIHEIGSSASRRAQRELVDYLSSPRFDVRMEALLALEKMHGLEPAAEAALIAEVERQPFTTAYVAARILGKNGHTAALPCLRNAAGAYDYMLQGSAMVALARLGDRESVAAIEDVLSMAMNPRVRISAAYALELLGSRQSVPTLISCMRRKESAAFVTDELVLSTASILGLMPRFYSIYTGFLQDEATGRALLADAAAEPRGRDRRALAAFEASFAPALDAILADPHDGAPISRLILADRDPDAIDIILAEAALDPFLGYRGFRFFIAAYSALRP